MSSETITIILYILTMISFSITLYLILKLIHKIVNQDVEFPCPVCHTKKYLTYITGTHAEGRSSTGNDEEYLPGDCKVSECYECRKCGGNLYIDYEIVNGKTKYLKITYKNYI